MKKIKQLLLLGLIIMLPHLLKAQLKVQRAMFSQYQFNALSINPAYSATDAQGRITALSRHQWVGFDGAPQTQTLSGYVTLPNEKTSLGATIIHDQLGVENEEALFLSLAQKVQLSDEAYLAAGFTAGIGYYAGDFGTLPEDPNANPDPYFINQSAWRSNVGLGVIYYDAKWELGFSVPYLVKFNVGASNATTSIKPLRSDYFLMANYRFPLNDYIKLKPALLVKYTAGVPMQFDVNMNAYFEEKGLWVGLGYRSVAAVMAMFQVKLTDRIQLGYSHDFMTNIQAKHQLGTHEIMLNYRFKGGKSAYNANDFRF